MVWITLFTMLSKEVRWTITLVVFGTKKAVTGNTSPSIFTWIKSATCCF